ncbi:MAG: hypothetical protein IJ689_01350 [Alphaproteobacteria bacterium]|nr:hypothetical protein [Alphaproteobacteria bacterium]
MNKYILMLGIAGIALGSYTAYANNEATMTVTATIAHDVSLTKVDDIHFDMTVNPAVTSLEDGRLFPGDPYAPENSGVTAFSGNVGTFRGNIPNPDDAVENSKFTFSPDTLTSSTLSVSFWDGCITYNSGTSLFEVNPMISYHNGAPGAGDHNFGSVLITYHP